VHHRSRGHHFFGTRRQASAASTPTTATIEEPIEELPETTVPEADFYIRARKALLVERLPLPDGRRGS
jgi:hypothetical protein